MALCVAGLQATVEKEEARRKLLLQASHLIIDPKEMFMIFPVVLSLVSVCTKIVSCSFSENDNFSDTANQRGPSFPKRKKKTMEELCRMASHLGMGRTQNK